MKTEHVYSKAKKFVDEQLKIDRRHGYSPKLSREGYEKLVRQVVRATARLASGNVKRSHRKA